MNKRGQFYIIISVILAIAVFAVTATPNKLQEAILFEDFEDLSNNYIHESEYVINEALSDPTNDLINHPDDVVTILDDFTSGYLRYAKQRAPNLQLLYAYSNGEKVFLVNRFDEEAEGDIYMLGSGTGVIQDISIEVGGKDFSYKVPVKAEKFGKNWYSATPDWDNFDLSIGGVVHPFQFDGGYPSLRVIINLESEDPIIPFEVGEGEWEIQYSTPLEEKDIKIRQVKIR
jgi:hypothetical protein